MAIEGKLISQLPSKETLDGSEKLIIEDAEGSKHTTIGKLGGYKTITWDNSTNANNIKEAGLYIIDGVHSNSGDNLPTTAYANGYIGGFMSVTVSTKDEELNEQIIGHNLTLSNKVSGETKQYVRSCVIKGDVETWTAWKEVNTIQMFGTKSSGIATKADIDAAIDNGQYAGVYMGADGFLPQGATFTLTVINNYAATAASSLPANYRQITQLFICTPLSTTGKVVPSKMVKRDGIGGDSISWSALENVGGSKPINDGDIVLPDKTTMTLDTYKASGRSDAIGVIVDAAKKLFVRKQLIYDPLIGDEATDEIKDILVNVCDKNSDGKDILNNLIFVWNLKGNNSGDFARYFPVFYMLDAGVYGFGYNAFIIDSTLAKRIFSTDTIKKSLNHLGIHENTYVTCNVYKRDSNFYNVFYYCFGSYQSSGTVVGDKCYRKLIVDIL